MRPKKSSKKLMIQQNFMYFLSLFFLADQKHTTSAYANSFVCIKTYLCPWKRTISARTKTLFLHQMTQKQQIYNGQISTFVLETQWSCFWQQANVHLDFHPILDKNVFIFFCSKTKPYNLKNSNDDQVTQIQNTQTNLDAHSLDVGNL